VEPIASPLVTWGIGLLAVVVAGLVVLGLARVTSRRGTLLAALTIAGAMAIVGLLASRGVLARFDARPPPLLICLVFVMIGTIGAARSRLGAKLARGLPMAALIGFGAFRLPLELVMHRAASEGVMPVQMSFGGYNFDIVTGASAVVVAVLAAQGRAPRWLLMTWNVLGITLLLNIVVIALASQPALHAFGAEPARLNTLVGYFPFVWLPTVLVPAALLEHLVVFRKLAAANGG
jgi:hypothetical protein